jgi:hypothetical protein
MFSSSDATEADHATNLHISMILSLRAAATVAVNHAGERIFGWRDFLTALTHRALAMPSTRF